MGIAGAKAVTGTVICWPHLGLKTSSLPICGGPMARYNIVRGKPFNRNAECPPPPFAAPLPLKANASQLQVNRCPTQPDRSEEHTSELQSLMRISYAVFC